jgi:hypothetical protein
MQLLKQTPILDKIMEIVVSYAQQSTCHRSKCGSIIVDCPFTPTFNVIGAGYNSMPCNKEAACFKDSLASTFKSDKTCCIHAEQRAIMDGLARTPGLSQLAATLFFIRLDEGNPKPSGKPYCSICSKMALDAGLSMFCLWSKDGWIAYDTEEYNELTFKYQ